MNVLLVMEGVRKLLRDLNPSKASGPGEVTCRLLKELADELAPILRVLFEQLLHTGTVLKDWKRAKVTPVFKQEGQHPLTGQRAANFRLLANQRAECRRPRFPVNRFKFWQSDSI